MHHYRANTAPMSLDEGFRVLGALCFLTFDGACELGELVLCSCMFQDEGLSVSVLWTEDSPCLRIHLNLSQQQPVFSSFLFRVTAHC